MTSPRRSMHRGHNSAARPDRQMGRMRGFRATITGAGRRLMKHEANRKRRQRDAKEAQL